MMYYVYVLKDEEGKFYIGFTEDLTRRLAEHLRGNVTTTSRMNKIALIYYEACRTKQDAMAREIQLKTGFGRGYLKRRLQYDLRARSSVG